MRESESTGIGNRKVHVLYIRSIKRYATVQQEDFTTLSIGEPQTLKMVLQRGYIEQRQNTKNQINIMSKQPNPSKQRKLIRLTTTEKTQASSSTAPISSSPPTP